jgi:tryptophanyl-tRNA synthetase
MRTHFGGMRYGDLKKTVAEVVVESLRPIQKRFNEIMSEVGYLDSVLKQGMVRVLPIAQDTVNLVKERMGLYTAS